jgi:hypothetical protein
MLAGLLPNLVLDCTDESVRLAKRVFELLDLWCFWNGRWIFIQQGVRDFGVHTAAIPIGSILNAFTHPSWETND